MRYFCKLWILMYFYCLGINSVNTESEADDKFREKRQVNGIPLVFPYGAIYKLLVGASFPIQNKEKISLAFAANFQYQYSQFTNISQLSQYYFIKTVSREQREVALKANRNERLTFYKALENLMETQGMNGQECILRAVCEAAQYPMEEEGLFGEILHILLTPDYGHSPFEVQDLEWKASISRYMDAATAGRQMFSCSSVYSDCPEGQGLLEIITSLRDH